MALAKVVWRTSDNAYACILAHHTYSRFYMNKLRHRRHSRRHRCTSRVKGRKSFKIRAYSGGARARGDGGKIGKVIAEDRLGS